MANREDIDRVVKAAEGRGKTPSKRLNPEDCECCTPSMAGAVLGQISRQGRLRKPTPRLQSPRARAVQKAPKAGVTAPMKPAGDESIDKVALRAGLHVVKAVWKPKQTTPDGVFFDLGTGELVGYATAREIFDEARRLGAKRAAQGALVRWTPPAQWSPRVRRREVRSKFWRAVDNAWPYQYAAIRLESGAGSRGKTVELDVLSRAGFSGKDRGVLEGLGREAELLAARGLSVGLDHIDAMTLGFVGARSSEGLTREQAYEAMRWRTAVTPAAEVSAKPAAPSKEATHRSPSKASTSPAGSSEASADLAAVLMGLRKGDIVEVTARALRRSPRTVTITGPVDRETGKGSGIVYVPTSSGGVRSGHRAGGLLSLRSDGTVRYQPTLQQAEVDVEALRVVSAQARASGEAPPTSDPPAQSIATSGPPVRMDVVLRDLKDAAQAKNTYVERKHVATAVRAMLDARRLGLRVTTPNYSMASTLDIHKQGSGRFTAEQDGALRALFGEGSASSNSFMVLVSRFANDANSVPTGIVPGRIEEFRRRVAEAAGLRPPAPFDPGAKPSKPNVRSTAFGLSTDEVVRLVSMLLDLARDAGLEATAGLRSSTGEVLVEYGARDGIRGQSRLSASEQGLVFIQGLEGNPDNGRVFDLFVRELAPVVSHGKPHRSGEAHLFFGLPPQRRQAGLEAKERVFQKRFAREFPMRIVELPAEAAANSAPSATELGRSKGIGVAPVGAEGPDPSTPAETRRAGAVPKEGAPVRMDHLLRDLRDTARAKGSDVERKHVAKALRSMLQAKRRGLSITTPQHSFATTLDIGPGQGRSQFGVVQNAALADVFGEDGGRSDLFMVLVDPFIGDSSSVPTGVRPARVDEFRRLVAKAAGLPPPLPYVEAKAPAASAPPTDRMSDEEILTLAEAFVRYANRHKASTEPLQVASNEYAVMVRTGPLGVGQTVFSIRPGDQGFVVSYAEDSRLAELFLDTFAAPMRGDPKNKTTRTQSFTWAPRAEQASRWAKTMAEYATPGVETGPTLGVGRPDHDERRDGRVQRLRGRAGKARGEAKSRREASLRDLPPWGEPIKIGHHSEGRHRRALERSNVNMFKSVDATRKAARLDARADAAESNTAISGDDPQALARLRAKLAQMEADRDEAKRKNLLARQGKLPNAENPLNPASIRDIAGERKYPMPGYALTNLGAEIRRVRKRIETLSKREKRAARSLQRGEVRVVENGELNRLQLFTGSKPPSENRTWLKRHGFRWARSEGAWQRQIGDGAWNDAMHYLDTYVEKRDDTPYARVEGAATKPKYTAADVDFWREEFAQLDAEFPGKEFDETTQTKVIGALRARASGDPGEQALAYGRYRTGQMTLEDAVALLFHYGRSARPKPRPKRPRKPVSSSMGLEAFIAAVKERGAEAGGQLFATKGPFGVHFNHYNVPNDTRDGARRENNRMMLSIDGWERGGGPPKDGKVKLVIGVAKRLQGLRGQTTTPEKMVEVVVEMFRQHSALKSV